MTGPNIIDAVDAVDPTTAVSGPNLDILCRCVLGMLARQGVASETSETSGMPCDDLGMTSRHRFLL
jgi:hypothetical protein